MTILMNGLSRLQAKIAELWATYSAGKMDLAAVSFATNTAIELAKSLDAEIQPLIDEQKGTTLFHKIYVVAVSQAVSISFFARKKMEDDYNFDAYDIADALLMNAHSAIMVFTSNFGVGDVAFYNGKWGRFDDNRNPPPTTRVRKYARDKTTLQRILQDL